MKVLILKLDSTGIDKSDLPPFESIYLVAENVLCFFTNWVGKTVIILSHELRYIVKETPDEITKLINNESV